MLRTILTSCTHDPELNPPSALWAIDPFVGNYLDEGNVQLVLKNRTCLGLLAVREVLKHLRIHLRTAPIGVVMRLLDLPLQNVYPNPACVVRPDVKAEDHCSKHDCYYDQFRFHRMVNPRIPPPMILDSCLRGSAGSLLPHRLVGTFPGEA